MKGVLILNKKNYKEPCAQITSFECADIITASELGTSISGDKKPITGGTGYVFVGGKSWNDIKKSQ